MAIKPTLSIRIDIGEHRLGPGKAAVLRAINKTGSISAAARSLNMSYRRVWGLVDEMNSLTAERLVETETGGARHGGSSLTARGEEVLALYEAVTQNAAEGARKPLARIGRLVVKRAGA